VGRLTPKARALIAVCEKALVKGIKQARIGCRIGDISHAIQSYVESRGFCVVRRFVGHGIGRKLHLAPEIPNFGIKGEGDLIREGMVLAIEPMITGGGHAVEVLGDGWTVVTKDRQWSAHFEHSIALTAHGAEILTQCPAT